MITFYIEGYNSNTNDIKKTISEETIVELLGLNEYDFCELSDIPSIRRKIIFHLNNPKISDSVKNELNEFSEFLNSLQEQSKKAFWI